MNQFDSSETDKTVSILVTMCFICMILSRILGWIFLTNFQVKLSTLIKLPLHISGLVDFQYIIQDSTSYNPHNSIKFYLLNVLSLFCFPSYIITVVLIDCFYQGIDRQIISVVVLLSSINEFFTFYQYGSKYSTTIDHKTIQYMIIYYFEFLLSLSFLGLIIINIRYSLPFLITYFCVIFILTILLPSTTNTFFAENERLNGLFKIFFLSSLWLCNYQPCLNKIEFNSKFFASISNNNNKFLVTVKFFFYQFAYWFFVGYKDEIYDSVEDSSQIVALFVIASISQVKLAYDVIFSYWKIFQNKRQELAIQNTHELDRLVKSIQDKKEDTKNLKEIFINIFPILINSDIEKIFNLCMCHLPNCEIIINNGSNGRYFYKGDKEKNELIVKLNDLKYTSYKSFTNINKKENQILPNIKFFTMNLLQISDKDNKTLYPFLNTIHKSNIIHFNIQCDGHSKTVQPIALLQAEQTKGIMNYLVFNACIAQHLSVNPQLVIFDLYDD